MWATKSVFFCPSFIQWRADDRIQSIAQQEIIPAFCRRGVSGLTPWMGKQGVDSPDYLATGLLHLHLSPLETAKRRA